MFKAFLSFNEKFNKIRGIGDEELAGEASGGAGAIPIPNKKSKMKKEPNSVEIKRRELSKRDIQPTVFHSSERIIVCLQNPFKPKV